MAAGVAVVAVVLGALDPVGERWLLLGMWAVLVVPAVFTGWLCAPRILEPWRGRLAPHTKAAVTASTSTAAFIWPGTLAMMIGVDLVLGRLDPSSWAEASALSGVLISLVPTSIAVLISLVVTVPLGVAWVALTRRFIGRDVAPGGH